MHKLYELKDMLCEELEEYGSKNKLDVGGLDIVDKLSHTIKNLDKIIEKYEDEGYSERGSYDDGMMYNRSYARRDNMGRYSREGRRSMRRGYSRDDGMIMELRELMKDAPDEKTRMEFERFISKIEGM